MQSNSADNIQIINGTIIETVDENEDVTADVNNESVMESIGKPLEQCNISAPSVPEVPPVVPPASAKPAVPVVQPKPAVPPKPQSKAPIDIVVLIAHHTKKVHKMVLDKYKGAWTMQMDPKTGKIGVLHVKGHGGVTREPTQEERDEVLDFIRGIKFEMTVN